MDPTTIFTTAKLLETIISKSIEIGIERLADGAPAKFRDEVDMLRQQTAQTRQQHIEAALRDAVDKVRADFGQQTDQMGGNIVDWFDNDALLTELSAKVLLDERPNIDALRTHLRAKISNEQWQDLRRPLLTFMTEFSTRMEQDLLHGSVLRDFRTEASLESIDSNTLKLVDLVTELSATAQQLPADIGEQVERRLHPLDLDDLERIYLRGLYSECNKLPLASGNERNPDIPQNRQPRLQRIYVDLDVNQMPSMELLLNRLAIPVADRQNMAEKLHRVRNTWVHSGSTQLSDIKWSQIINGPSDQPLADLKAKEILLEDSRIVLGLFELHSFIDDDILTEIEEQLGVANGSIRPALVPQTVLETMQQQTQLVLTGDPGGGKSTLTRRLAGVLASNYLEDLDSEEMQALARVENSYGRWLLPVRVVLSRWATHLNDDATGCADDLIQECLRIQRAVGSSADDRVGQRFQARLVAEEPTVLLLLDGLDEVSDARKRQTLLDAVRAFCEHYPAVPLIVTCRIRPYKVWQDEGMALTLPVAQIGWLSPTAIQDFIERWHAELTYATIYEPSAAQLAQTRLTNALADHDRHELRDMAQTPLLLTMMARVNAQSGLPNSRAMLYEEYVNQLLWEWERSKQDDRGQSTNLEKLLTRAGVSRGSLENALNKLAYQFHGQALVDSENVEESEDEGAAARDTVDIPRHALRSALEAIHSSKDAAEKAAWAVDVLHLIDDRTGLLYAPDDEIFHFSHRTFQEYLAARYLATGKHLPKFKEKIDLEAWREAVFLALGFQIAVPPSAYDNALDVFHELLPETPTSMAEWRRVLLLGEGYVKLMGEQVAGEADQEKIAKEVIAQMPRALTAAMQEATLPATERLFAGQLLAQLGKEPPGLDDFISTPNWPFQIGRYPVTNAQFRRFVDDGGYKNDEWWQDEEGREYRDKNQWSKPRYWNDNDLNWPTQPVVGISWYEANAYCAWLTKQLHNNQTIAADHVVRLPTQEEWMLAARASQSAYPWGRDDFDATHANTEESNLNQTTPVHMYPAGATEDGVWDLSGNVWEWSNDVDDDGYPWVKGGAWYWDADNAKSSARHYWLPNFRDSVSGFRCVVVPVSLR